MQWEQSSNFIKCTVRKNTDEGQRALGVKRSDSNNEDEQNSLSVYDVNNKYGSSLI